MVRAIVDADNGGEEQHDHADDHIAVERCHEPAIAEDERRSGRPDPEEAEEIVKDARRFFLVRAERFAADRLSS